MGQGGGMVKAKWWIVGFHGFNLIRAMHARL
jgi:hypothetical protein